MAEPSVIVYARHFGLSQNYLEHDPEKHLDLVQSETLQSPSFPDKDYQELAAGFEQAAKEYRSLKNDGPLDVAKNVADYLRRCTQPEKPDMAGVYRALLPDPHRIKKHKLQMPLLLIGGGDVEKDVRRVRKGVDITRMIDEVLEDYEELDKQKDTLKSAKEEVAKEEALKAVRRQLEHGLKNEVLEVSKETLSYLHKTLVPSMPASERQELLEQHMPQRQRLPVPTAISIAEEDFDIESDSEDSQKDEAKEPPSSDALGYNSSRIKEELGTSAQDVLSRGEAAIDEQADEQVYEWAVPTQLDEEAEDLFNQFTNDDLADDLQQIDVFPPRKRQKLTQESLDLNEVDSTVKKDSSTFNDYPVFAAGILPKRLKVDVPCMASAGTRSPGLTLAPLMDAVRLEDNYQATRPEQEEPKLPFTAPGLSDVLKVEQVENSTLLEKFLGKPKPIVTSNQLLWKEPGLRLLDRSDTDEENLVIEDFEIGSESDSTSTDPQSTEPHEKPVAVIKQEPPREATAQVKGDDRQSLGTVPSPKPVKLELASPYAESKAKSRVYQPNPFVSPSRPVPASKPTKVLDTADPEKKLPQLTQAPLKTKVTAFDINAAKRPEKSFASDSLAGFLELKGKQFKLPSVPRLAKIKEIDEDPIQSTQQSVYDEEETYKAKSAGDFEMATEPPIEQEIVPFLTPLYRPAVVIVNNALLQTKPLLIQFLERQNPDKLTLIYRDLDGPAGKGPDVILNPTSCVLITNLQLLNQRPLPGQKSKTGLSSVHDQVAVLAQQYDYVFVLVHHVKPGNQQASQKTIFAQAGFAAFCQGLPQNTTSGAGSVCPLWLPCIKAASTSELVNAWVWNLIVQHAHQNPASQSGKTLAALIQDETLWELLLVKAGLNPMAAQVVIGTLKRPGMPGGTSAGSDPNWGLRRLVTMKPNERHCIHDKLIGQRAIGRLNKALSS